MTEDDDQKGYTWEAGYADGLNIREVLEEDEGGSIEKSIAKLVSEARKKHRTIEKPSKIRLGIMRYVYVAIDCSRSMTSKVMPPSRFFVTMKILNTFVDKFFEQNPISQLGIIIVKDKKAERFVSLTGNTRALKDNLGSLNEAICSGDFSLQNALQLALINLKSLPGHVSREVIVIMSSLSTVDPGNVFSTFEVLRGHNIRCSVIGISAELFVCKQLAKITNGRTAALSVFKSVQEIQGPLHFAKTKNLGKVEFFNNLKEIRSDGAAFVLLNNVGLLSLKLPSLRKITFSKATKAVQLHSNDEFDTSGFISQMKAKGLLDHDIINTTNSGVLNSLATVIVLQLLFVIMLFLVALAIYHLIVEFRAWRVLSKKDKEYTRYRPPPTNH
ncbi:hypothetical protein GCK32_007881 [Trichostrongylus colubriformis]|uniref:VWFA domain-containing protein n=1 Tax=Trichostrongylus colubriformis TaxID=6319 RepID=A0AAN8F7V1_TRICO